PILFAFAIYPAPAFCRRRHQPKRTRDLIACQWPRSVSVCMIVFAPVCAAATTSIGFAAQLRQSLIFGQTEVGGPALAATSGVPPILPPAVLTPARSLPSG